MLGFVLCIFLEGITGTGVIPFVTCKGIFPNVLLFVAYAGGIAGIGWLMVQINANKNIDEQWTTATKPPAATVQVGPPAISPNKTAATPVLAVLFSARRRKSANPP